MCSRSLATKNFRTIRGARRERDGRRRRAAGDGADVPAPARPPTGDASARVPPPARGARSTRRRRAAHRGDASVPRVRAVPRRRRRRARDRAHARAAGVPRLLASPRDRRGDRSGRARGRRLVQPAVRSELRVAAARDRAGYGARPGRRRGVVPVPVRRRPSRDGEEDRGGDRAGDDAGDGRREGGGDGASGPGRRGGGGGGGGFAAATERRALHRVSEDGRVFVREGVSVSPSHRRRVR